jgi:hypothetical protein
VGPRLRIITHDVHVGCKCGRCDALHFCAPREAASSSSSSISSLSCSSLLTSSSFFWAAAFELRPRCARCDPNGSVPGKPSTSQGHQQLASSGAYTVHCTITQTPSPITIATDMGANVVTVLEHLLHCRRRRRRLKSRRARRPPAAASEPIAARGPHGRAAMLAAMQVAWLAGRQAVTLATADGAQAAARHLQLHHLASRCRAATSARWVV